MFFFCFFLPAYWFFATPAQYSLLLLSFIALFAAAAAAGSAGRLEVQVPAAATPVRSRLQRRQGERCRAEDALAFLCVEEAQTKFTVTCSVCGDASESRAGARIKVNYWKHLTMDANCVLPESFN